MEEKKGCFQVFIWIMLVRKIYACESERVDNKLPSPGENTDNNCSNGKWTRFVIAFIRISAAFAKCSCSHDMALESNSRMYKPSTSVKTLQFWQDLLVFTSGYLNTRPREHIFCSQLLFSSSSSFVFKIHRLIFPTSLDFMSISSAFCSVGLSAPSITRLSIL